MTNEQLNQRLANRQSSLKSQIVGLKARNARLKQVLRSNGKTIEVVERVARTEGELAAMSEFGRFLDQCLVLSVEQVAPSAAPIADHESEEE